MPVIHANKSQLKRIAVFDTSNYIAFDTETTGLDTSSDEILEMAIVDNKGSILFNERFRPLRHTSWPEAQEKHHISPQNVVNARPFAEYIPTLQAIFESANLIVAYNLEYDMNMLAGNGLVVTNNRQIDLMTEYAPIYGEWADWKNDYKWMKLADVARHYNYSYQPHSALSDAYATAHCYREFVHDCRHRVNKTADKTIRTLAMVAIALAFAAIITALGFPVSSLMGIAAFVLLIVFLLKLYERKRNKH